MKTDYESMLAYTLKELLTALESKDPAKITTATNRARGVLWLRPKKETATGFQTPALLARFATAPVLPPSRN